MKHNFCNEAIRWQISTAAKIVQFIFVPDLTASEILMFQNLYFQKVGQGHGVQFSQ